MSDFEEILRKNPKAAAGVQDAQKVLESIQQTIENINRLRAAGLVIGPDLSHPLGGRKTIAELKSAQRNRLSKGSFMLDA